MKEHVFKGRLQIFYRAYFTVVCSYRIYDVVKRLFAMRQKLERASGELIIKPAIAKQSEISANISNLFQEFARDVLNVEMTTNPMSQMRSLFKPFLEEKKDRGQNLKTLERNRKHIFDNMKIMKDRLKLIDKRIREIKEAKKRYLNRKIQLYAKTLFDNSL